MGAFSEYLERLRELVPARTLTLYLLGTGLASTLGSTPEEVRDKYGWMLLVVALVCLVLNFIGRIIDKQGVAAAAISTGAFLLLTLTQRFTGPLAALKLDSPAVYMLFTFLAAVYVVVVSMVWKTPPK